MSSGKAYVDELLKTKKVVVISKTYCPFCVTAKNVLKKYKIKADCIVIIDIENRKDMGEIQLVTPRIAFHHSTIPQSLICRTT